MSCHHQKEVVEEGCKYQSNLFVRTGNDGKELLLWSRTIGKYTSMPKAGYSNDIEQRRISSALAYAQECLFSKACHILTSSGIVPNNNTVFELLKSKHPLSDPPITPAIPTTRAIHVLPVFSISTVLQSFLKGTACGPWLMGSASF